MNHIHKLISCGMQAGSGDVESADPPMDWISPELRCEIISYLTVTDMAKMSLMNRSWRDAVTQHLKLATCITFSAGK